MGRLRSLSCVLSCVLFFGLSSDDFLSFATLQRPAHMRNVQPLLGALISANHGSMDQNTRAVDRVALDIDTVARMLSVSPSTIRNRVKDGELAHIKLGKRILIPRAAIDALLDPEPPKANRGRPRKEIGA